jgi:hypothetical protein
VQKKIHITKSLIENALKNTAWDLGNKVLYDLCHEYREHNNDNEIIAKVLLIGRTYAAAIERRKINTKIGSDKFYEDTVAKQIRTSKIDEWLATIPGKMTDPLADLSRAVEVHKQVTELFSKMTGLEKRSLASKYLHFHKPEIFYIYDSRAKAALSAIIPKPKQIAEIQPDKAKKADKEYLSFVRRCQWLRDNIEKQFGKALTPREFDKVLLKIHEISR